MTITLLLLILLLLSGTQCGLFPKSSLETQFFAQGNLKCLHHHPKWCYSVALMEKDWLETDDILDTDGAHCRYTDTQPFRLFGVDDGDGPNDDFYELTIEISHNCSQNGDILRMTKRFKPTSVRAKKSYIQFTVDVTNRGKVVDDYWSFR